MQQLCFWILLILSVGLVGVPSAVGDEQAVARQYNFRSYSAFDGLAQAQVTSIQQDERGYIWVGSYAGVTRYNGQDFVAFTAPLPNNFISSMIKDQDGRVVLTAGNGFCVLKNDEFDCTPLGQNLILSNLNSAYSDSDGSLWFAAEGGVIHYKDNQSKLYQIDEGVISPTVRVVFKDSRRTVWVGTRKGLATLNNGKFNRYKPEIFGDALVRTIIETNDGVWIGSDKGLHLISKANDRLVTLGEGSFDRDVILSLYNDSNENLWIGTYKGLFRLVNGKIEKLSPQRGLLSVAVYAITEDREGVLWFGSDAGLVKYVPGPFVTYTKNQGLSDDFVRSMSVDAAGKIWMGTRFGVSILTPETEHIKTLTTELESDRIRVYSVQTLENNSALIGTRAGLIYWKDNQVAAHYSTDDGLKSSFVSSILVDSKNRVWLGTTRGLSRWQDSEIKNVVDSQFPIGAIYSMKQDLKGRIWLGTGNLGLVLFDPDKEKYTKIEHIPSVNNVTIWNMDLDSKGNIWVGTNGNGLLKISENLKLIETFDTKNKLGNDFVWQVKSDSNNNIWAYTNSGLKRYDQIRMTHFDGADGLPDMEGAATAVVEHPNGDLWFGTGYGVTRFIPGLEKKEMKAPTIILEGAWNGTKKLENDVKLPHDVGPLTIKFSSLTFRNERDIKYSFRLIGSNEQWSEPQNMRTLQLAGLAAGRYELQVRSERFEKSSRVFSNKIASFAFSIEPPFWLTWWSISSGFILIVIVVGLVIQRRVKKLAGEKYVLETIVAERTAELSCINDELNRLVVVDDLTSIFNRRHLMECLQRELALLFRSSVNSNLSFIIIDVDFFKMVNDTHGHRVGDEVLARLAQRICVSCRKTDIAARYGGEEFAVILPFTDSAGALTCAKKIRTDISEKPFEIDSLSLNITISLGVVTIENSKVKGDNDEFDRIIKKADIALYKAKEQGRNRACLYDPDVDTIR